MIELVIKTLEKLIDTVEENKVKYVLYSNGDQVVLFGDHEFNRIDIHLKIVRITTEIGTEVCVDITEDSRYKILDLCQRLKRSCENYTISRFQDFVIESNDDLE